MFYPLLFENPNAIYIKDTHSAVDWTQMRTLAFSYYNDIMYIGSNRSTHVTLYADSRVEDPIARHRYGRGKYAGRLFVSPKVITFWEFPETNSILMQLLKDIEEETSFKFDDSWKVEVPIIYHRDDGKEGDWGSWEPRSGSQNFVPISKYNGAVTRSEEEMRQKHVMPPIEKEKYKKENPIVKGFGTDKTAWDSPDNIRVRQQRITSESVKSRFK